MLFGSRYQPEDYWHSNGQREHSEKRKLPQNQVSECGTAILCSVVLCALIVSLHFDVGRLWRKASLPNKRAHHPTSQILTSIESFQLHINATSNSYISFRTHVIHVFLNLAFLSIFLIWTDSSHTCYISQAFLTSQRS